jgi:hypothetical protein
MTPTSPITSAIGGVASLAYAAFEWRYGLFRRRSSTGRPSTVVVIAVVVGVGLLVVALTRALTQ